MICGLLLYIIFNQQRNYNTKFSSIADLILSEFLALSHQGRILDISAYKNNSRVSIWSVYSSRFQRFFYANYQPSLLYIVYLVILVSHVSAFKIERVCFHREGVLYRE